MASTEAELMSGAPVFRPEWTFSDQGGYMEKRQLFLRSYHFSRKKSAMERVRCSAVRVRRLIWVRLRAARRLPRLLWHSLRCAWNGRRRFHRLIIIHPHRPTICCNSD